MNVLFVPPPGTPVEVVWRDHYQPSGPAWWNAEDVQALTATTCTTVGYLIDADADRVVVASSIAPQDEHTPDLYGSPFVILRPCIVTLRSLTPCV
jgi:hypothetical protein